MTDRTELRRLLDKATPGPWTAGNSFDWNACVYGDDGTTLADLGTMDNARLIAAAVNDLEPLLDAAAERDALAAKLAEVRELAEHYAGLTNVDAGSAILRALDTTPKGGES